MSRSGKHLPTNGSKLAPVFPSGDLPFGKQSGAGGFEPGLGRGTVTRLVGLGVGVLEIAGLPEFDEGARAGGGGAFQFFG